MSLQNLGTISKPRNTDTIPRERDYSIISWQSGRAKQTGYKNSFSPHLNQRTELSSSTTVNHLFEALSVYQKLCQVHITQITSLKSSQSLKVSTRSRLLCKQNEKDLKCEKYNRKGTYPVSRPHSGTQHLPQDGAGGISSDPAVCGRIGSSEGPAEQRLLP